MKVEIYVDKVVYVIDVIKVCDFNGCLLVFFIVIL